MHMDLSGSELQPPILVLDRSPSLTELCTQLKRDLSNFQLQRSSEHVLRDRVDKRIGDEDRGGGIPRTQT